MQSPEYNTLIRELMTKLAVNVATNGKSIVCSAIAGPGVWVFERYGGGGEGGGSRGTEDYSHFACFAEGPLATRLRRNGALFSLEQLPTANPLIFVP